MRVVAMVIALLSAATPAAADLVWAEQLRGAPVESRSGVPLGDISGLLLDEAGGTIIYAVLRYRSRGGLLVAVPWMALHQSRNGDGYVVEIPEQLIRAAPFGDPSVVASDTWQDSVEGYWRQRAALPVW